MLTILGDIRRYILCYVLRSLNSYPVWFGLLMYLFSVLFVSSAGVFILLTSIFVSYTEGVFQLMNGEVWHIVL
jgi:hypothetical protein